MIPGTHIAVVSKDCFETFSGRFQGWELRDTLLVLTPGPSTLYVFLFRVPLQESTVIAQVLKTGTSGLNIDACRIGTQTKTNSSSPSKFRQVVHNYGRWPSNLLLIHHAECVNDQAWTCHPSCPVRLLDKQSGERPSGTSNGNALVGEIPTKGIPLRRGTLISRYDTGGASRFYPQFKNLSECLDWINKLINPNFTRIATLQSKERSNTAT